MASPKRFIAGAVCPRCAEMDRVVMFTTDTGQVRECVACGFTDRQADLETASEAVTPTEIPTRVNTRHNQDDHTVKQVVFFKSGPTGGNDEGS
jgi:uncharacterized metal-binding protein (TIGR02443 family)